MNIGKRFKTYRVKANLSQLEAAKLIGVKNYQLGNYETNRSEPSIATLKKMSEVYNSSISTCSSASFDFLTLKFPTSASIETL